jgi:hypothetical protein
MPAREDGPEVDHGEADVSVTESDMEDWAALWAEEPSREEQHELARVARRASWRGTLIEYADLGFAICIALCILGAIALQPQPATLAIGLLSAGGLFWSSKKRHMLRQATLLAEARDRVVLLEHEIARTSAEHKRAAIGMWATPLVILSGAMLAYLLTHSGSLAGFGASLVESMTKVPDHRGYPGLDLSAGAACAAAQAGPRRASLAPRCISGRSAAGWLPARLITGFSAFSRTSDSFRPLARLKRRGRKGRHLVGGPPGPAG